MKKGIQKKSYKSSLLFGALFLGMATVLTVALSQGSLFRSTDNFASKITGDSVTADEWNYLVKELPGEFIGFSAASTGSVGGYTGADGMCAAANAGSRVCSMSELIRSYSRGVSSWNVTLPDGTSTPYQAWVSEGAPGDFAPVNDCSGWTSASGSENGAIFSFFLEKALITECSVPLGPIPFACCK